MLISLTSQFHLVWKRQSYSQLKHCHCFFSCAITKNEGRLCGGLSSLDIAHIRLRQETWEPNPSYPLNNSCTSIGFKHYHRILDTIPESYTALVKVQRQAKDNWSVLQLMAHSMKQQPELWCLASTHCKDWNVLMNPIFEKKKSHLWHHWILLLS